MSVGTDLRKIATSYTTEELGRRIIEEMADLTQVLCKVEKFGISVNRRNELVNSLSNVLISARLLENVIGHAEISESIKHKVEKEAKKCS